MKVFLVEPEHCGYDEYDSFVVVEENSKKAIGQVKEEFNESQGTITASEIDLSKADVILGSYRPG